MICISGVPKTGKTTICKLLNLNNIPCENLDSLATELGCLRDGEVDVERLAEKLPEKRVVESHYSHLLSCDFVIILSTDEMVLENRMREAGYDLGKIAENIDAQRSEIIFSEALEKVPRNRIFLIETGDRTPEETFNEIRNKIIELEKLIQSERSRGEIRNPK